MAKAVPGDLTRSPSRALPVTATVAFREQGSREIHHGVRVQRVPDGLCFETAYAVAPGARVRLRLYPDSGDAGTMEAYMHVVRVDTLPGRGFQVTTRLGG